MEASKYSSNFQIIWTALALALCYTCGFLTVVSADVQINSTESTVDYVAYSELDYPDPSKNVKECGASSYGYVCDPGHSISSSQLVELNNLIRTLRKVDTCLCDSSCKRTRRLHHFIMVAIVPRLKYKFGGFPTSDRQEKLRIQSFAENLRDEAWSRSDSTDCPIHLYIVYDVFTNRIWTATNFYARKIISDERAHDVGWDARSEYLSKDKIYEGIKGMIDEYKTDLEKGIPGGMEWWKILLIIIACIFGVAVISFCVYKSICEDSHCCDGWSNGGSTSYHPSHYGHGYCDSPHYGDSGGGGGGDGGGGEGRGGGC